MIVLQADTVFPVEHVTLVVVTIIRVLYSMVNVHAPTEVVLQMLIRQFVPHLHKPQQLRLRLVLQVRQKGAKTIVRILAHNSALPKTM